MRGLANHRVSGKRHHILWVGLWAGNYVGHLFISGRATPPINTIPTSEREPGIRFRFHSFHLKSSLVNQYRNIASYAAALEGPLWKVIPSVLASDARRCQAKVRVRKIRTGLLVQNAIYALNGIRDSGYRAQGERTHDCIYAGVRQGDSLFRQTQKFLIQLVPPFLDWVRCA
jgi:hypothetical protein